MNTLLHNDEIVQALSRSLARGIDGLGNVPRLIVSILESCAWRDRVLSVTGEEVHFTSFTDFVVAAPPIGLGASTADLERICRDDIEALSLLDHALRRGRGRRPFRERQRRSDGENAATLQDGTAPTGNSRRSALRRLEDQRPDLLERVLQGEISAHRAAIIAGFRSETFTVPRDIGQMAQTLLHRLTCEEINELRTRLGSADIT